MRNALSSLGSLNFLLYMDIAIDQSSGNCFSSCYSTGTYLSNSFREARYDNDDEIFDGEQKL